MSAAIDITFDFRADAGGKDPDAASPTLRRYHKLLWSKPVPGGGMFDLSESSQGMRLRHCSELGEFVLSSDAVITTLAGRPEMNAIADQLSEADNEAFKAIGCTIEIFAWTEVGPDVFSTLDPGIFADTVDIAANQGVYNLFLAAGLIWSLVISDPVWRFRVAICFLLFVAIAGITAAATIAVSSGLPQLVPSVLAIIATFMNRATESKSTR